ncbi:hypothetical protein A4A49_14575 [Nicotiana attenuata]|uniref:Uncharacterized protein n=1 Tax=Nicotiana attenuata TaxID=49451 RepID=A0A1J6J1P1_NICAT|nr:hypothetical protein A4A49_14575 [Nicotiana attenuata]
MQARKNKYQRDNRGHIVDNKQGKEADKGKGKAKLEEVETKNKFNSLEVEEVHQPTLQITEGKGKDHSNGKKKEHGEKQSKKGQEKEKEGNTGVSSLNHKASGEAVEKVLEDQHNGNLAKANSIVPSDQSTYERANKESTIDWVHRRFGTRKEELRQLNVTTNQSCQDIPSQTFADSGQLEDLDEAVASSMENSKEKADEHAIVKRASGEIEEVPMESGTDQIMQLHLNVPLKTPLQYLHDLVTHNVAPIDEDLLRQNPMEDDGDDESTAENFKQVAREGDISPTASANGVYRNNVISRYWMVQFILLLICSNVKEMAEFVMLHFWRLLNHFSVVLACFHAQSEDGLAMFRMMSTLKVWVEKDLSLKDHKITLLHKPGGARLKPNYTWLDPGVASLKPGFSLAKPA